ncbi:MAG TPA: VWA domain-containing protein, partial [Anaerolineales bacterium]|nr:VWA domain-containing protein [Anaerolineales bacterium]
YMLKLRRREVEVSSTLLWSKLLRERQANSPWQRLKRNILLILQLIILSLLVFTLARPAIPVPAVAGGSMVVLLDASASMNATDVPPNRFEAGRAAIQTLIDNLANQAQMSIILVGSTPRLLASKESDKTALHSALESASPSLGEADWQAAFALAAGAISANPDASLERGPNANVVVVSDGGLPRQGLPSLPGEVLFVPIGNGNDNLAMSALALRPNGEAAELFARATNYGSLDHTAIFSVYGDGKLLTARQVSLPAHQSVNIVLPDLPLERVIYQARLVPPDSSSQSLDSLSADDLAYAVSYPASTGRTLLVTASPSGNFFLEQLLVALPHITPYRVLPSVDGSIQLPNDPFDLYVFDGILPDPLPAANMLLIDPPPNDLFEIQGVFSDATGVQVMDGPVTRFVDWDTVHVSRAKQVSLPAWGEALVDSDHGPLVFGGEYAGHRMAVITFNLHDSDLPLQVAFPILFANLMQYLSPAPPFDANADLLPGESLAIKPDPSIEEIKITTPSGNAFRYNPGEEGVFFSETGEPGIYEVNYTGGGEQTTDFFAVNLFAPSESDIEPAQSIRVGQSEIPQTAETALGKRDLWPWLAAIGLLFLIAEWGIYHRSFSRLTNWRELLNQENL